MLDEFKMCLSCYPVEKTKTTYKKQKNSWGVAPTLIGLLALWELRAVSASAVSQPLPLQGSAQTSPPLKASLWHPQPELVKLGQIPYHTQSNLHLYSLHIGCLLFMSLFSQLDHVLQREELYLTLTISPALSLALEHRMPLVNVE